MLRKLTCLSLGFAALAFVLVVGCDQAGAPKTEPPAPEKGPEAKASDKKEGEGAHAHKPGGHGGSIVEIGRDNYHAEAVFEKNGAVRLYK